MASSLMATQTICILRNPTTTNHRIASAFLLPSPHSHLRLTISKPNSLSFSPLPKPFKSRISASVSAASTNPLIESPNNPEILSGSTRTVTTLVALGLTASRFLARGVLKLAVQLKEPLLCAAGPAFFAAARDIPTGSLNTPFTVVAAGMAKWLDLYSGVLMVRVLLSWFPNIPWDRQPLSAIRDLCDPYLNLFRNIIPPIFDTLDVSPLLAFAVLGTLGSILNSSRQAY
ncbi:YGGT family protein [Perilla frutescens var. hirtella]|uniref:YGGT family protein n=1 Tax=Perilla frutescens var. hirtella TaxID=608512 RepID=A0AAD4JQ91_PERFH|nr:YGGT family protein [Perilla frutescens var. hirtella]